MKTATIWVNRVLFTNKWAACVLYRGKVIKHFDQSDVSSAYSSVRQGIIDACKIFAQSRGFTHFKIEADK